MSLLFSRLKRQINKNAGKLPSDVSKLTFGTTFSPHMLVVDWDAKTGWGEPWIKPLEKFSLHPASSCFHYGIECFEGLKAFRGQKNEIRIFRADQNMKRLKSSLSRLQLPSDFSEVELEKMIQALVLTDQEFVPKENGYSMYIRPTCIGTHESVGVAPSSSAKLFVLTSPVGPYYPTGFKPIKILAETTYTRAWPGGTGAYKLGANYAIALGPQTEAQKKGYSQVLWLFGPDDELTEVGTMNLIVVFGDPKTGKVKEVVTAPLESGLILPGITRDSALHLTRAWGYKTSERKVTMKEVVDARKNNELLEVFGVGTAAVVSPVESIHYRGSNIDIPLTVNGKMGPVAKQIWDELSDIQYGRIESPWSVVCKDN